MAASLGSLTSLTAGYCSEATAEHTARLDGDTLHLVIADNQAYGAEHRAGYNGIAGLHLGPGNQKNLFVPNYAGLNLEHVFSGDATSFGWNIFEPRRSPMQLIRRAKNRVELHQEKTGHWPFRSRLIYEVKADGIDFT